MAGRRRVDWKLVLILGVVGAAGAGVYSSAFWRPEPIRTRVQRNQPEAPAAVVDKGPRLVGPAHSERAPDDSTEGVRRAEAAPTPPTPAGMRDSIAPLVERVEHSVVAIQSTKVIRRVVREPPLYEYLRNRLGEEAPIRREVERGLGSGFIIDADGTVLTNNHVVAGADEVEILLDDGRRMPAHVVGSDPSSDVAVVKIDNPSGDLEPAVLGDSDTVRVGDYVVAIGNPLGLGKTVTMGIVSAKHRSLGTQLGDVPEQYQDFIQTDAAINQGNSGGPLFNFAGEVIGVNSAILNPALAMNVGFAIPINLAMQIAGQLKRAGRVARGFLGVDTVDIHPDNAAELGVSAQRGAFVRVVVPGSPAEKAGLRVGDVIQEIGTRKIDRRNALVQAVAALQPGVSVTIRFLRGGRVMETDVVMAERAAGIELPALQLVVAPLGAAEARELGLRTGQGLRVVHVNPRGPTSGELREGDVIVAVNRTVATPEVLNQFERLLLRGGWGRLIVVRDGRTLTLTLSG